MNSIHIRILVLLLLMLPPVLSHAQVNDAGLWASVELEKSLTKKFRLSISEEFRFNENITELGTIQSEIGLDYRISGLIGVSGAYRFSNKRRLDNSYNNRHRFIGNLNLRNKFGRVNLAFRLRYQSQYVNVYSSDDGKVPSNYVRTKLSAKYDLDKKYLPYISGEAFYNINRPEGILFDNYRLMAGIEYEFNKRTSLDLGYMIDREINVRDPWTGYNIVIGLQYKL